MGSVYILNGYMSSESSKETAVIQSLDFCGDVDSNYANSLHDKQLVTGYVNLLASGSVTWLTTIRASVALSTMEAEYMMLAAEVQV